DAAVRLLRLAGGALPEGDQPRQGRLVQRAGRLRSVPAPLAEPLHELERKEQPGDAGPLPAAGGPRAGPRAARQAGPLPVRGPPAAALPAGPDGLGGETGDRTGPEPRGVRRGGQGGRSAAMAKIKAEQPLVPSVLDRLLDDDPDVSREPA